MKVVAICFALALSACGSIQNPLNQTRLVGIESSYGIALAGANAYRALYQVNRCTKTALESFSNICARRSIVVAMQSADRKAQVAMAAARTFVANNPTISAASVLDAAQISVDSFKSIVDQNKVQ